MEAYATPYIGSNDALYGSITMMKWAAVEVPVRDRRAHDLGEGSSGSRMRYY